jgi:hypothetical protein
VTRQALPTAVSRRSYVTRDALPCRGYVASLFRPFIQILFSTARFFVLIFSAHFIIVGDVFLPTKLSSPQSHHRPSSPLFSNILQPPTASTAVIHNNPSPSRHPCLSNLHRRNREVALNLLNCSNKSFNFTSNRFSGIKVSSRLPLFSVLFWRRFRVTEETNLLVSGPWVWQKTLSSYHCPFTGIPTFSLRALIHASFGCCLSADPGFRQINLSLFHCPSTSI